ncbi:hypothetical protein QRX60_07845 [Amycolatopsis mongoliensis]|uniref:Uncharacterized protein n=1 Tax=Amycolatopsis mongoliensis TaxID=715475 RepID=A0A9Y2JSC3_9PSEU|nr:hypothetical protein [Amycolatopsis sp. 4-36]WIY03755.1 hypothetical protein QRX60_07845 [Amycolatopsis sp. 4-36]
MDPTPEPPARRGGAFLTPALVALALALTVAGTFLPFFRTDQLVGWETAGVARSVVGAWRVDFTFPGQPETSSPSAPLGLPLVLASAILLAALVLGVRQAATRHPGAAASRTAFGGAAFLAGAVCTIGMQGARRLLDDGPALTKTTILAGMWLLMAAVLVAVAAAVLSLRRPAAGRPEWADPAVAFADTTTPPSGVAITVLPPDDD